MGPSAGAGCGCHHALLHHEQRAGILWPGVSAARRDSGPVRQIAIARSGAHAGGGPARVMPRSAGLTRPPRVTVGQVMSRAGRVGPVRAGGLLLRGPGAWVPQLPSVASGRSADGAGRAVV